MCDGERVFEYGCVIYWGDTYRNQFDAVTRWCKSDMAGWERPPKTAEEGADTAEWLSTANHEASGKFFGERAEIPW